ncbi:hypothetical protein SANTM175S_01656 [Streptomyces antimycoticus]
MAEVSAQTRIEAPAEKVWARLTDFSTYGDWNATHTSFPRAARPRWKWRRPMRRT